MLWKLEEQHERGGMPHRYTVAVDDQLSQVTPTSPTFSLGVHAFSPPPNKG